MTYDLQHPMRVAAILPTYSPSTVINVVVPLQYLHRQGQIQTIIRTENEVTPQGVFSADVIVLCRNVEPIYRPVYEFAAQLGIPMVYVLDDNLLAAPDGTESHTYYCHPTRKAQYEWILKQTALIRAHSPVLRDVVRGYNPRVSLVWAAINWALVPRELPRLSVDPIHIVYAAQKESGQLLFDRMAPDLKHLMGHYGSHVQLHFMGFNPSELRGHPGVHQVAYETDYDRFLSQFTRFGYAIGLAPLRDELFYQCKTNTKFRDYSAAGAVGIYSDCALYRETVIDGETGLLVSGQPGSWFPALQALIEAPDRIETIRRNARRFSEDRYSLERVGKMWMDDFSELPTRPAVTAAMESTYHQTQWWFTNLRRSDTPLVARLRGVLRERLPMQWKLIYYDLRNSIKRRTR